MGLKDCYYPWLWSGRGRGGGSRPTLKHPTLERPHWAISVWRAPLEGDQGQFRLGPMAHGCVSLPLLTRAGAGPGTSTWRRDAGQLQWSCLPFPCCPHFPHIITNLWHSTAQGLRPAQKAPSPSACPNPPYSVELTSKLGWYE